MTPSWRESPPWREGSALESEVRALFAERLELPEERVTMASTLNELDVTYGMRLELALAVEEAFDVELRESQLRRAHTVGDWVAMVRRAGDAGFADRLSLPELTDLPPSSELPPSVFPDSVAPDSVAC